MKRFCIIPAILIAICVQAQTPTQYLRHTVEWNETVYSIPVHYNISTKDFLATNGLAGDAKLVAGQTVVIRPLTPSEVLALAKKDMPEKKYAPAKASAVIEEPAQTEQPVAVKVKEESANQEQEKYEPYIAVENSTPGAYTKSIVPEQKMVVDVQAVVAKIEKARQEFNSIEPKKPTREVLPNEDLGPNGIVYTISNNGYHQVEKKQTFYHIALIYGLTVEELKQINNMTTTDIMIGQKLKVDMEQANL